MRKFLCLTLLLSIPGFSSASCIDVNGNYYVVKIHVKNSTKSDLQLVGCDPVYAGTSQNRGAYIGNGTVLSPQQSGEFGWMFCPQGSSSPGLTAVTCTIRDISQTPNKDILLQLTMNNCVSIDPFTPVPPPSPPNYTIYTCPEWNSKGYDGPWPEHDGDPTYGCPTKSLQHQSHMDQYVEIIAYPSYTITWNKVMMSLPQGQVLANKLGHDLLNALSYKQLTSATYNQQAQQLKIVLDQPPPTNPYAGKTGNQCATVIL